MYLGKMVELASVDELYKDPRHPYTVALLSAIPNPNPRLKKKRLVLKGDIPSPANPPSGCRFHTRCWLRERLGNPERCTTEDPAFREYKPGHTVACHFAEEMNAVGGELKAAIGLEAGAPGAAAIPPASAPAEADPAAIAAEADPSAPAPT